MPKFAAYAKNIIITMISLEAPVVLATRLIL
jgi:hypothetical protein